MGEHRDMLETGLGHLGNLVAAQTLKKDHPGLWEECCNSYIDWLVNTYKALGVAVIHIQTREHQIPMYDILGKDDPRFAQLGNQYRDLLRHCV